MIEFPHDTTRAAISLLYSGSLARLRDVRFIFSNASGTIPPLAGGLPNSEASTALTQEPLAARAASWLAICSFIFCCISLGVGCAMWVATIQV
jgi:hypothetical protein